MKWCKGKWGRTLISIYLGIKHKVNRRWFLTNTWSQYCIVITIHDKDSPRADNKSINDSKSRIFIANKKNTKCSMKNTKRHVFGIIAEYKINI